MNNPLLDTYYNQTNSDVVTSYSFYDVYEVALSSRSPTDICGCCIFVFCVGGFLYGMCNG